MNQIKLFPMVLALALSFFAGHLTARTVLPQEKDNRAPAFTLELLKGGEVKSSELTGKIAVLKFMASY